MFLRADPLQGPLDRHCSYSSSPLEAQWKDYYEPQTAELWEFWRLLIGTIAVQFHQKFLLPFLWYHYGFLLFLFCSVGWIAPTLKIMQKHVMCSANNLRHPAISCPFRFELEENPFGNWFMGCHSCSVETTLCNYGTQPIILFQRN